MLFRVATATAIFILIVSGGSTSWAKVKGSTQTIPTPPKIKPQDPMRIFPGMEVPAEPERFKWKLSSKGLLNAQSQTQAAESNPPSANPGGIPVYAFDASGFRQKLGSLPEDTPVKLEHVRVFSRTNYYRVPFNAESQPKSGKATAAKGKGASTQTAQDAWINGRYVIPDGYAADAK